VELGSKVKHLDVRLLIDLVWVCAFLWILFGHNGARPVPALWYRTGRALQTGARWLGQAGMVCEARYWRSMG